MFWQSAKSSATSTGPSGRDWTNRRPAIRPSCGAQFETNLKAIAETITGDDVLVDYLADRLVELGDSVPAEIPGLRRIRTATRGTTSGCGIFGTIRAICT